MLQYILQLVGGEIFLYWTVARKIHRVFKEE